MNDYKCIILPHRFDAAGETGEPVVYEVSADSFIAAVGEAMYHVGRLDESESGFWHEVVSVRMRKE